MKEARQTSAVGLDAELVAELEQIAAAAGCQLENAEWKGGVLRLVLDRPEGGVGLSDCEQVSKQVSALLDVVDFGKNRYTLEVSSPGLDRQLYRPRDYARFTGRLARVTYRVPESGAKRTVVGRLEEFHPEREEVVLAAERGERLLLHLHDIETARLEIEL
jgi:ribosome maturation factor RimP